ncbi:hypothetical protein CHU92_05225 [Flavobacterium cyanobacteriorum]|uniref:GLPGLI family protein n=1 Tax=Flavobacterium cyanobacteriorum TaxID=2022802 RepID=A0A255ZAC3_9FLAO|nr:GLPGLI family protein [Flavobacterium cyanobacteriorum]OYQ38406.1 hypothetical protein CHU92_05225 [Flavobacterium cyanobacteriorum]
MKPLFSILIFCQVMLSQTLTVKYNSILLDQKDDYGNYYFENGVLITNQDNSTYTIIPKDTIVENEILGSISSSSNDYKQVFFKDIKNGTVIYDETNGMGGRTRLVKDDTYRITWKINDNHKIILGYEAQEATGWFRGREYRAYFASKIPYSNGPFKFDGLPGLVLEVISEDKTVHIRAKEITKSSETIYCPFNISERMLTWAEFKKIYKLYFEKTISYRSSSDSQIVVPNRGIEYYVD